MNSEVPDEDISGVEVAGKVGVKIGVGDASAMEVNATMVGIVLRSKVGGATGWLKLGTAHAIIEKNRINPAMYFLFIL
jgi:hypothetical protein